MSKDSPPPTINDAYNAAKDAHHKIKRLKDVKEKDPMKFTNSCNEAEQDLKEAVKKVGEALRDLGNRGAGSIAISLNPGLFSPGTIPHTIKELFEAAKKLVETRG